MNTIDAFQNPSNLLLLFGLSLILIGLLGGGLDIISVKIPQIGLAVRVLSILLGFAFVSIGWDRSPSQPIAEHSGLSAQADSQQSEPNNEDQAQADSDQSEPNNEDQR
jgi:hypothetical protein